MVVPGIGARRILYLGGLNLLYVIEIAMSLMDVNRKRSFRPGRAAISASVAPGAAGFYLAPTIEAAAPAPLDAAAVTLSKWVSEHFDTLEHDDIAHFLVFGHTQFGRDG